MAIAVLSASVTGRPFFVMMHSSTGLPGWAPRITAAEASYRRNHERIRNGQGLPIETLQSIQALDQSRRQYIRAVADFNRSQFRLQRVLGWPVAPHRSPADDQAFADETSTWW
jgi:outer membrane protein TolC